MAIEAELHRQRLGAVGQRHLVDAAVAFDAADALGDVDVVAEEDVLRQHRDAIPVERFVFGEARAHRRQHRRAGPDLRMAGHAGVGRRQAGARAFRDRRVAIAAIDAELAGVVPVAERHRLRRRMDVRSGHPIRVSKPDGEDDAANSQRDRANQKQAQPGVGGRRENLAHQWTGTVDKPRFSTSFDAVEFPEELASGTLAVPVR